MGFHPVIPVVCAQLQELGKVHMPRIQIDGCCTLANAQLIDGNGSVIDDPDPANDTAGRSFETADTAAAGTHFAQIHSHAPAKL